MAGKFPYVSRYQNGFANGVEILGVPVLNSYPNNVYWVCATDGSNQNKGTRDRPFATLAKAVSTAADDKGDVIVLAANHRETITDALNINKRGLTIMGLGLGGMKPEILLDSTTVTDGIDVSSAYVTVANFRVLSGTSDMVAAFDVDAAGFTADGIELLDNATHENFLVGFDMGSTTDNVVDGFTIAGCTYHTATGSHTAFIRAAGRTKRPTIVSNRYSCKNHADAAGQFIAGTAGDDWWDATMTDNVIDVTVTATDTYPFLNGNVDTDNSGVIARNIVGSAISNTSATNTHNIKALGFRFAENYNTGADLGGGVLWPTATEGS